MIAKEILGGEFDVSATLPLINRGSFGLDHVVTDVDLPYRGLSRLCYSCE
jgi:hypothetical protein